MALDNLPDWLPAWCGEHLGSEPADVLFQLHQTSMVCGLRLADGTDVVVKARAGEGRAASCVVAQAWLAERGFPCARPLTAAVAVGSLAVHAEEFRRGGDVLPGDSPDVAVSYAEVFARLMDELNDLTIVPPLPNPAGCVGTTRTLGCGRRLIHSKSGTKTPCPRTSLTQPGESVYGYWPQTCHACWGTLTLRHRTSGGMVARFGQCTTGTAWRGNQKRRSWERRVGHFKHLGAHVGVDRKFRSISDQVSGHSGAFIHGGRAGGRVGGQLVVGSAQRPMGSSTRRPSGVRQCPSSTNSRTLRRANA